MTPVERMIAVVATGLVLQLPDARAQSAGAEALFREGRTLIAQGKVEAGCDKLTASEKLESSVGTLLNLGDCREKLGQTATAWAAFRKAEAMAKRDGNDKKRQQEAKRRALKLEPDLAHVTIQVGPRSRSDGMIVRRNGVSLDSSVWDTSIVVDPGQHTIVAEAPGLRPWKSEVSVGKGGKRWVVVPTLEPEPKPAPPVVIGGGVTVPPPVVVTPPPDVMTVVTTPVATRTTTTTWSTTRQIAVGVGVAGVGALAGGAYYGSRAKDLQAQSDAICPNVECGDPQGLRLNDRAQDEARRANIFFLAGGAALATATVLWFVGAPDEEVVLAPSIGTSQVGATLRGRF